MATENDAIKKIRKDLGKSVTESERIVISEIKHAFDTKDVRAELLWIFTLGKMHNRWASSVREDECVSQVASSLDATYSPSNVSDEFEYAQRFLTSYENDIVDGSDIHKGKIVAAVRDVIQSDEFKNIIASSTHRSVTSVIKDSKVQLFGSIFIAGFFFLLGNFT